MPKISLTWDKIKKMGTIHYEHGHCRCLSSKGAHPETDCEICGKDPETSHCGICHAVHENPNIFDNAVKQLSDDIDAEIMKKLNIL